MSAAGAPGTLARDRTLWGILERRAALTPDRPMIIDSEERIISFGAFKERAERVARALFKNGIGPDSVVAWQLPTRIETALLMAALARLDAVQIPIVPLFREREVGFLLREIRPQFYFVPGVWRGHDYRAMVDSLSRDLKAPPTILTAYDALPELDVGELPPVPDGGNCVRWIFTTSGTTSDPKGVRHTDQSLIASSEATGSVLELTSNDIYSINFPIAHGGGPTTVMTLMIYGVTAISVEVFDSVRTIELYRRKGVTIAGCGLPFYVAYLAEQRKAPGQRILPNLRVLFGGGGPMPPNIYFDVKHELGVPILHVWGMTEALMLSEHRLGDSDDQLANTVGVPAAGVDVQIVRPDGSRARTGEVGEILVRGPGVCAGYTNAELTAGAFTASGYLRTGDLGSIRSDGRIVITGRVKDIIIRKGENISALEIENVLYTHPKIAEVAVIGLPDPERGERACAVVVPADDDPISFEEMVEACRDAQLATYKIPEQLEFVSVLPRNSMMKVLKAELRQAILSRGDTRPIS